MYVTKGKPVISRPFCHFPAIRKQCIIKLVILIRNN